MLFFDINMFSVVSTYFIFKMLNFSWSGNFLLVEGAYNYFLFFLSIYIFFIIFFSEKNKIIITLSIFLVYICLFFFFVSNFFLLYCFFELSLIPMLMMILFYGMQIEKIHSTYYLVFYSVLTTFPFMFIYFNLEYFTNNVYFDFVLSEEFIFFLVLGFLMKFPVYFLHFWLPKAHVESPSSGSMLLAGLLLKLGTLGFTRFLGAIYFIHTFYFLLIAMIGLIVCCFVCMIQSDCKSLVAYSSVVHMSFLLFSFMMYSMFSKNSSLIMMLAHGYVSVIIFFMIGEFYHVCLTRLFYFFNSFFFSNFFFCLLFTYFLLFNSGIPPSLSFFSEFFGVISFFNYSYYLLWMLFMYFFCSFYYSLYMILNSFLGKTFINLNYISILVSISYVVMSLNIFWLFYF